MSESFLPPDGASAVALLDELDSLAKDDLRWEDGRAFSLAYSAGPEVLALQKEVLSRFQSTNSLNTDAFPSLRRLQADVIDAVCGLFHGGEGAVGVFTSGGTESILTAIKGAREWGRARGISAPEMVLPNTAHAAFSKGAKYFDVTARRVPVGTDYRADVEAMADAITPNTVLLVGSAPSYPQGVIDPIAALGALATDRGVLLHVDACMGFTLPWLDRLGLLRPGTRYGFDVEGVTSISCDLHKYGYTAKGASVLAHRSKDLRKHQFFLTDDWLGGRYGSPAILGTRSGGSIAAAWAVMRHLGEAGYLRVTRQAFEARQRIQQGLAAVEGLAIRGEPETTLVAWGAADAPAGGGASPTLDVFAVGDHLWTDGGWYCDRQGPPDSLHCTVNAVHDGKDEAFLAAVARSVAAVGTSQTGDRKKSYAKID